MTFLCLSTSGSEPVSVAVFVLSVHVFALPCMRKCLSLCMPVRASLCLCVSLSEYANLWSAFDRGFFCLGASAFAAGPWVLQPECLGWAVSASASAGWLRGEGLQGPALGNDFLARKAVVFPVLFHLLPLFLFRRLPQSRLSGHLPAPIPSRAKSAPLPAS